MIFYLQIILVFQDFSQEEEHSLSNQKSEKSIAILLCFFTISLIITFVFITGCGDEEDSPTDMVSGTHDHSDHDHEQVIEIPDPVDPPNPADPSVSFRNDILPILAVSCALANCHSGLSPSGGLDLTDYTNFKDGAAGGPVFVPGDGEGSLVVTLIDNGNMPIIGERLTQEQVQLFIDWIDDGAKNN